MSAVQPPQGGAWADHQPPERIMSIGLLVLAHERVQGSSTHWGDAVMHARHAVAVLTIILVGFGVKLYFFPTPTAEADESSVKASSMEVLKMHENIKLPTQKIHDMTFVFSEGD
jgi:hypothetical protein